jgi:enoyl-CoA hydratase/carnithine racemase
MLVELSTAFRDASFDDAVAVVVLSGAGDRAFCTGADMKEQQQFVERPRDYYKWMGAFIEAHEKLRNIGKPTLARLNGIVVGGGNEFNLSCDLAIAADDIYIRQVGASRGSVAAAGATQRCRWPWRKARARDPAAQRRNYGTASAGVGTGQSGGAARTAGRGRARDDAEANRQVPGDRALYAAAVELLEGFRLAHDHRPCA